MRRALLAVALAAAAGCSPEPRTEVVVVVSQHDLVVPRDLDSLHIAVADVAGGGSNVRFDSSSLPLCAADQAGGGCYTLPLTLTLAPGKRHGDDPVRVVVEARLGAQTVIADASVFTFVHGQSQRLDFVLHPLCLNTSCAESNRACDATGNCAPLTPTPLHGEPALDGGAPGGGSDLAVGDMAPADDMPPPPDMTTTRPCGSLQLTAAATSMATAPHQAAYNGTTLTVEAWVYLTAYPTGANPAIVAAHGPTNVGATKRSWWLSIDNQGALHMSISTDGTGEASTSPGTGGYVVPLNQWTHVAGQVDLTGGTMAAWVHGRTAVGTPVSITTPPKPNTEPLYLGNSPAGDSAFSGLISLVAISSNARYSGLDAGPPPTQFNVADPKLVTLYNFNDLGSVAHDAAPAHNDATVSAPASLSATCRPKRCGYGSFNSGNGYGDTMSNTMLNLQSSFTIEAWVARSTRYVGNTNHYNILAFANSTTNSWFLRLYGNTPLFAMVCGGSEVRANGPTSINDFVWHHLATTYDLPTNMLTVWVDGKPGTPTSPTCTSPNYLSSNAALSFSEAWGWQVADDWVDEVRISTKVRYTQPFTPSLGDFTNDPDTIALYHFNDAAGTTAADSSGLNDTLTLHNTAALVTGCR